MLWASLFLLSATLLYAWWLRSVISLMRIDHERALNRMRTNHERLLADEVASSNALIHSMVEGVLLLDGNGRVVSANAAMRRLFGVGPDAKGRSVMETVRLHQVQDLVQRTQEEGQVLDLVIEQQMLGSASRFFQVNSKRIPDARGGVLGIVVVFHDVTKLKLLEETRREFVGNVSHELRTPLSIIKGYAETLASMPTDAATTQKFAGIVERHADRLTALVEDLLTISGLESGQMALNVLPVDVHKLVTRVLDELEEKAAKRGVELRNEIVPGFTVRADSGRLQQVLMNLVDNAMKYGRENGVVTVEAATHGDEQELSVSDDGQGIPPEARDRVFERFYRVDKARSRDQGGTGLGLSIVKHIMQAHGGRVWVDSSVSQGAKFCLRLPV